MQAVKNIGNRYFHFLMLIFLPFSLCTLFITPSNAASLNDQAAKDIYSAHIVSGIKIAKVDLVAKEKKSIKTSSYVQNIRSLTLHIKPHFAVNVYTINSTLKYIQPEFAISKELMALLFKPVLNCRGPPSELFFSAYRNFNSTSTFNFNLLFVAFLLLLGLFTLKLNINTCFIDLYLTSFEKLHSNRKDKLLVSYQLRSIIAILLLSLQLIRPLHLFIKSNNRLFILSYTSIKQELIITIGDMLCSKI